MYSAVNNILVLAFGTAIAEHLNVLLRSQPKLPPRTPYQQAICEAAMARQKHVVTRGVAGCGKTTTIMHVLEDFPGANKRASTSHSYGFNAYRFHVSKHGIKNVDVDQYKVPTLLAQLLHVDQLNADDQARANQKIGPAVKLISYMKNQGFLAIRSEATDDDLREICMKFDISLPDPIDGITEEEIFDLARQGLTASNNQIKIIDFDDMIYLPLLLKVNFLWNELILVDESQDLNPTQIALIKRAANDRAQVIFVGDENQAIFGFRGADVEAINSVTEIFDAIKLPLTTCWRCPKAVIRLAQQIVPEIEAAPDAIEGLVDTIYENDMFAKAEAGDFILCRTTAPLVDACMKFIRSGKAATVRGRDIGQGLQALCDKIKRRRSCKGKNVMDAIFTYRDEMTPKLSHPRKESQLQSLTDKLDTLTVLAEECDSIDQLKAKIESIFSEVKDQDDMKNLIVCSTAHKAKGLEAENVYIIRPDLMPHPAARQAWQQKQEMNLKYVAITRATRELHFVLEGNSPSSQDKPESEAKSNTQPEPAKPTKSKRTAKSTTKKATRKAVKAK